MKHLLLAFAFGLFIGGLAQGETNAGEESARAYETGLAAERAEQFRQARSAFRAACTAGEARACSAYGRLLRHGQGGVKDEKAAERFYIRGCKGGDVIGCTTLGFLYNYGLGGAPDYVASRKYYEIACRSENVSACAALGNQQYAGIGGPIDRISGKRLMRNACAADFKWACDQLRQLGLAVSNR